MNKVEKSENKEARSYAESRLEYFKAQRERCRETLYLWEYQKSEKQYDQYDLQTIHGMCSDLVREISYLDDVIEMLEKAEVEA